MLLCDPPGTRTRNLLLRRQLLYPIELADHRLLKNSAERGGFEPPVRFPARMFSKHVVSATHPSLRMNVIALKRNAKLDKNNYYPNLNSHKNASSYQQVFHTRHYKTLSCLPKRI